MWGVPASRWSSRGRPDLAAATGRVVNQSNTSYRQCRQLTNGNTSPLFVIFFSFMTVIHYMLCFCSSRELAKTFSRIVVVGINGWFKYHAIFKPTETLYPKKFLNKNSCNLLETRLWYVILNICDRWEVKQTGVAYSQILHVSRAFLQSFMGLQEKACPQNVNDLMTRRDMKKKIISGRETAQKMMRQK